MKVQATRLQAKNVGYRDFKNFNEKEFLADFKLVVKIFLEKVNTRTKITNFFVISFTPS